MIMIDGPLLGSREIKLIPLGARETKIDVSWDIQFAEIPVFAQEFVRSGLEEGTKEALDKIANAAKGPRKKLHVESTKDWIIQRARISEEYLPNGAIGEL